MTSAQLEPSAHAPWISTTLRASTGTAGWAWASNPPSVVASTPAAIAASIRNFVIVQNSVVEFSASNETLAGIRNSVGAARTRLVPKE